LLRASFTRHLIVFKKAGGKLYKRKKVILIAAAVIIVAGISGGVASAFYGLPWKKKAVAADLKVYLEEKYHQEFVQKEAFYNFKDGSYGAVFYPAGDSGLEFYAEEGFAEYPYVDTYPEVLWARQLKETVEPIAEKAEPEIASIETSYVTYESLDIVKGPEIPKFDEAGAALGVRFKLEKAFSESDKDWEKRAALIHEIQELSPSIDVAFNYIDKSKEKETYVTCPPKEEAAIESAEQARKSCSANDYKLEKE